MIAGIFHSGSGCGDQLFRYITVRTLAEEKGYDWGMQGSFKGSDFMDIDMGWPTIDLNGEDLNFPRKFQEKEVRDTNGNDVRSFDPESQFIEDNTIIDGSFEDSKYWGHNLKNINKWLEVEPLDVREDVCIVGFRGGEYASDSNLFLTPDYYSPAAQEILKLVNVRKFEVHTDDHNLAKSFFPANYEIVENQPISHSKHTNMGFNWRSARYAKHAIIPNSAFFIIPRLLKHHEDPEAVTIAPRYWARRNTKVWARPACYYKPLKYI